MTDKRLVIHITQDLIDKHGVEAVEAAIREQTEWIHTWIDKRFMCLRKPHSADVFKRHKDIIPSISNYMRWVAQGKQAKPFTITFSI